MKKDLEGISTMEALILINDKNASFYIHGEFPKLILLIAGREVYYKKEKRYYRIHKDELMDKLIETDYRNRSDGLCYGQ